MDWAMVGVISAILLAIAGGLAQLISVLVRNYFETLTGRMAEYETRLSAHVVAEEAHDIRMETILTTLKEAIIRIETQKDQFISIASHLESLRTVDTQITDTRHALRNEWQGALMKREILEHELARRIEMLERFMDTLKG
jgi:hypothetical protein